MQRNWIGRSEGAEVAFTIDAPGLPAAERQVTVFTTRPDTLFGATYMVLAPEHRLVDSILPAAWPADTPVIWKGQQPDATHSPQAAVAAYRTYAAARSDRERTDLAKEKTGVFTGAYAINPANGERIPVWIADYVLLSYGTGAIMAVPAHDTRDLEFARSFQSAHPHRRPGPRQHRVASVSSTTASASIPVSSPACPPPMPNAKSPTGLTNKVLARRA